MSSLKIKLNKNISLEELKKIISIENYQLKEQEKNEFSIIRKNKKEPDIIPNGYQLTYNEIVDTYQMTTSQEKKEKIFYYMDTQSFHDKSFQEFISNFSLKNIHLPENFWFSNQYRDFTDSWQNLEEAISYCQNFSPTNHTRLIEIEELLFLYYEEWLTRKIEKKIKEYSKGKIKITCSTIPLENWYFPVKIASKNYQKVIWEQDLLIEDLSKEEKKKEPLFAIPVIKEKILIKS